MNIEEAYKILGVTKSHSLEEIKKAYKAKAKKYHPDIYGDDSEFKKIKEAYDIIQKRHNSGKNKLRVTHVSITKFDIVGVN